MDKQNIFATIGLIFFCIAIGLSKNNTSGLIQMLCITLAWYFGLNTIEETK